jgi:hypothetical protein
MDVENRVFVAAFGKHPGWNDHITDMGADTAPLVKLKRDLYVNGIGGNIDAGSWDKLREEQRLPGFAHVFLHCEGGLAMVGRMWASRDGKGRSRYPMVVAVQCGAGPLPAWMDGILPRLENVESRCRAVSTASEVKEILSRLGADLRGLAAGIRSSPAASPAWMDAGQAQADLGAEGGNCPRDAFYRLFYRVRQTRDVPLVPKSRPVRNVRTGHFRVGAGDDLVRDLSLWTAMMRDIAGTAVPLLLMCPPNAGWADIVLGPPGAQQMVCLLASLQAIPLTTTVPYDVDQAIRDEADLWLSRWHDGRADWRALLAMDGTEDSQARSRTGFRTLFRRARSLVRPT